MKLVRILAVAPLALISLMNVGYTFGTDPKPNVGLAIAALVLGMAGFVAAYGLARSAGWAIAAALGVAGINVVAAIVALVSDTDGAIVGLVVSVVALALAFVAGSGSRTTSLA